MKKKYTFKVGIYCDVMKTEGFILETLEDVSNFKKQYSKLFERYVVDPYDKKIKRYNDLYVQFKDIHVPVSEGQAIIVEIRQYDHWKYINRAAWVEYNK
jgi:hypothetical protein